MFPSLPPIDEKKQRQQQYRRQLESQIAEKIPAPSHGRASSPVASTSSNPPPHKQALQIQQPILDSYQLDNVMNELGEMKFVIGNLLPKMHALEAKESKRFAIVCMPISLYLINLSCSHTVNRQMDSIRDQVDQLYHSIRESETSRMKSELNIMSSLNRDRETGAQAVHELKLYLSNIVGVGTNGFVSSSVPMLAEDGTVVTEPLGPSLLERQGALEASVKEDLTSIKRAISDLKSRVASTHLLLATTDGTGSGNKVVVGDVIDTMSKAIGKLSADNDKSHRKTSSIENMMTSMQASLEQQSVTLTDQVEELKTVLSAEITGRRKGQTKIQVSDQLFFNSVTKQVIVFNIIPIFLFTSCKRLFCKVF